MESQRINLTSWEQRQLLHRLLQTIGQLGIHVLITYCDFRNLMRNNIKYSIESINYILTSSADGNVGLWSLMSWMLMIKDRKAESDGDPLSRTISWIWREIWTPIWLFCVTQYLFVITRTSFRVGSFCSSRQWSFVHDHHLISTTRNMYSRFSKNM